MIDTAREVRPSLYVNAELFTGSLDRDVEYVSRLGIFAFRKRALRSMEQRRFTDERIWTLITKYEQANALHQSEAEMLAQQFNVFDTRIPQAEQIARAAEWSDQKRTVEQKYGAAAPVIRKFAAEFRERATEYRAGLLARRARSPR